MLRSATAISQPTQRASRFRSSSHFSRPTSPTPASPFSRKSPLKRKRSLSPLSENDPSSSPTKKQATKGSFRAPPSCALSACPTCLGRHPHDIANCKATQCWDGKEKNRCTRTGHGHLRAPDGTVLCTDWQKPRGCEDTTHSHKHQCSGCGATDHGAQDCPRAQAA